MSGDVPRREGEPRRLFGAGDPGDVLSRALGAARDDRPDARALNRLAARLPLVGLPSGGGGGAGHGGPGGAGHGPAAGGAGSPAGSTASAAAGAKATSIAPAAVGMSPTLSGALIGAALGVVVAGAGFTWQAVRGETAPPPAPIVVAPVETHAHVAPPEAPIAPAPPPPPEASAAPEAIASAAPTASAAPAISPSASASASASAAPGDAETEAAFLSRANATLTTDPAQALAMTDQHPTRFPHAVLGQERELLAIQALARLGRRADARARADRFLAANPASAHRRHIEALFAP